MARVDAGQTQQLRFMLTQDAPLHTERLKRVIFEGIPPASIMQDKVQLIVSQNLPVIIHPADLPRNDTPWTGLRWSIENGKLIVRNPGRYVVRLEQRVELLPSGGKAELPRTYILPDDRLEAALPPGPQAAASAVRLYPATVYGFSVDWYDASLEHPPRNPPPERDA